MSGYILEENLPKMSRAKKAFTDTDNNLSKNSISTKITFTNASNLWNGTFNKTRRMQCKKWRYVPFNKPGDRDA